MLYFLFYVNQKLKIHDINCIDDYADSATDQKVDTNIYLLHYGYTLYKSINLYKRNDAILKFRTRAPVLIYLLLLSGLSLSSACGSDNVRRMTFYNIHTCERLTVIYKEGDLFIPEGLTKINYILRDHRTGEICAVDPDLLDYLYDLLTAVGNHSEVHIISGYRSPKTNNILRRKSKGVAANSLHMQGRALDFRLMGTPTSILRDKALKMKRGGVGYYEKSDFIQIDTGRFRSW
jgi:uncharacterized protein YcbK (DUF882 family)